MARKNTLIHLHGTGRLDNPALLNKGEIAVRHAETKVETELAVKTTIGGEGGEDVNKFILDGYATVDEETDDGASELLEPTGDRTEEQHQFVCEGPGFAEF